ncbi:hypothetical protein MARA_01630 (plasmid) [Mycolicibacterium arabiense]|uniref:ESX secretion-associated protein EspG n=1 Tax=Mycolicibacterium arabiense TaxID=1286181 RepID=A0A7I7RQC6_9MYCO|nr:ESX secretion-associated protein EspG [Mycolicibacterium arabiense]MCV7376922.1 ESX secretion-associated protein EspG [Mycolicibacterium arabiense]BBY46733.1 hypothetical protein MARA_01630 [Mycolicibacterium arabiense]
MTTALAPEFTLTVDECAAAATLVGVDTLPVVLAIPRGRRQPVVVDRACRALRTAKLLDGDAVHPDLAGILQTLRRPDRELAMRFVTPDGFVRITVARRGDACALGRRIGDDVVLRAVGSDVGATKAASLLLAQLPKARAALVASVGAPLTEMAERLSGTHDSLELADSIRAMGVEPATAMTLGAALGAREAFAEVVYHAITDFEDRMARCPGAVAVFYTRRGRIISSPSASPSGELWATLKAGTDHAFTQAIEQLVELSPQRWTPSIGTTTWN